MFIQFFYGEYFFHILAKLVEFLHQCFFFQFCDVAQVVKVQKYI